MACATRVAGSIAIINRRQPCENCHSKLVENFSGKLQKIRPGDKSDNERQKWRYIAAEECTTCRKVFLEFATQMKAKSLPQNMGTLLHAFRFGISPRRSSVRSTYSSRLGVCQFLLITQCTTLRLTFAVQLLKTTCSCSTGAPHRIGSAVNEGACF